MTNLQLSLNTKQNVSLSLHSDLTQISNEELLQNTKKLVQHEREIVILVLEHLLEIERRLLHAEMAYHSLYEYCLKELHYSESEAQRRISAMRALRDFPEIRERIANGALSLSALALAQRFFRQEEILESATKLEVFHDLEWKTSRETERALLLKSKQPEKFIPEKVTPISENKSKVTLVLEGETLETIEAIKNLLAHNQPFISLGEIVKTCVTYFHEQNKPKPSKKAKAKAKAHAEAEVKPTAKTKTENAPGPHPSNTSQADYTKSCTNEDKSWSKNSAPAAQQVKQNPRAEHAKQISERRSRYIPQEIKREVYESSNGQCAYVDPASGRRCCCKYGLEYDHVVPFAQNGESTYKNLRLLCKTHNLLMASQSYGKEKNGAIRLFYANLCNVNSQNKQLKASHSDACRSLQVVTQPY